MGLHQSTLCRKEVSVGKKGDTLNLGPTILTFGHIFRIVKSDDNCRSEDVPTEDYRDKRRMSYTFVHLGSVRDVRFPASETEEVQDR